MNSRTLNNIFYNFLGRYFPKSVAPDLDRIKLLSESTLPRTVFFVCKGNVCRSVYAEYRLRELLRARGVRHVTTLSGGLAATPGKSAELSSVEEGNRRGLDLSKHHTRRAEQPLLEAADLIFAMEPYQCEEIHKRSPLARQKTTLLGYFSLSAGHSLVVSDPYGKSDEIYRACFEQIDAALSELVEIAFQK